MEEALMSKLAVLLFIEFSLLIAPLFFILADLRSGIRKAKQRGENITSRKLRDTVQKIARYYNVLFVLGVLDFMQMLCMWYMESYEGWSTPLFPFLTLIGSATIGLIEVKSILEPANEKEEKQRTEIMALAKAIATNTKDPAEIAKAVAEYLKSGEKK